MYQDYLNQLQVSINPLSSEELKDLLNNDEKLDTQIDSVLEMLKAQKDSLFSENRAKAERNIEKQPQIMELKGKLAELSDEGKQCCEAVQEKLSQIKEKSGGVTQALALLQTAAAESEETSDAIVKKFTDNEINVEGFLEEFLPARKTMHLRKLKAEKMQELMRPQTQAGPNPAPRNIGGGPAYGNIPLSGFYPAARPSYGGGVPYPMGPMMPMPPPRPY